MFDYVIIGAGTAGCVLANRLSADPGTRVCLIEAGGSNDGSLVRMPAAFAMLMWSPRHAWGYRSLPEPHLGGRELPVFCGRGLGGSSAINAMVHCRGAAVDYDAWAAAGNTGWGSTDVAAAFGRVEQMLRPAIPAELAWPLSDRFLEAAAQCGLAVHESLDHARSGAGRFGFTIHDGRRVSAASAYLDPVRQRPNLRVVTGARVRRILLDGDRAVGVTWEGDAGVETVFCAGEVLLAAGTFNSPLILMRSGIGPPAVLRETGLAVHHALAGVGENLQDHPDCSVVRNTLRARGPAMRPRAMWQALHAGSAWRRDGTGPFGRSVSEVGAFLHSGAHAGDAPDLQIHFLPMRYDRHGRDWRLAAGYGMTCRVSLLAPASRGWVRPGGPDAGDPPRIQYNLLAESADRERLATGMVRARALLSAPALDALAGRYCRPADDADPRADLRARASTTYHAVGTCRMGIGHDAVVDPALRVRGLRGLRVVDASIMPAIPRANTQATTAMIAERAADLILEEMERGNRP